MLLSELQRERMSTSATDTVTALLLETASKNAEPGVTDTAARR